MTLSPKPRSVKEVAEFVQARVIGDESVQLTGIASVRSARPGDLIFVDQEKNLYAALESQASALIADNFATEKTNSKPVLLASQPRLAFARAAQLLCAGPERKTGIHTSAVVHPTAHLGAGVAVEEKVIICEAVRIGENTRIGAGSVIGAHTNIGEGCELYPNVTIYPGGRL